MGDIAIRAEGLGKCYSIGRGGQHHDTLRDLLAESAKSVLKRRWKSEPDTEPFWALRDATFDIRQGENVGIIGLNGAGKSTLLKILSRIIEPSAGSARVIGRVGALLEVGTGFHWELTGRENVYLYGSILGMSKQEIARRFDEIVEFAEIAKFIDTPVKRYSSGMYVRLAFSVAAQLATGDPAARRGAGRRGRLVPAQVHRLREEPAEGQLNHPVRIAQHVQHQVDVRAGDLPETGTGALRRVYRSGH